MINSFGIRIYLMAFVLSWGQQTWSSNDLISPVTENDFWEVIHRLQELYPPVKSAGGIKPMIVGKWNDGLYSPYTRILGSVWSVRVPGGHARLPTMNADSLALVICHELGHFLGGEPKRVWETRGLLGEKERLLVSVEGQADYFAASECLKRYFEVDSNNQEIVASMRVPDIVRENCAKVFSDKEKNAICQRGVMAGYVFANTLRVNAGMEEIVSFSLSNTREVTDTLHGYPDIQCRFVTYFQGGLCDKEVMVDSDYRGNSCAGIEGSTLGRRPSCWFAPSSNF